MQNEKNGGTSEEATMIRSEAEQEPTMRENNEGTVCREGRTKNPPVWMRDYVVEQGVAEEEEVNMAIVAPLDPVCFEEAVKCSKWRAAMDAEINSIEKNQTWQLVELPAGIKRIGVRWIYKTKLNE